MMVWVYVLRDCHDHRGASAWSIVDADRATVGGHHLRHDRQPQPGAPTAAGTV